MSTKIRYTNTPVKSKVIQDFLPLPNQITYRETGAKATVALEMRKKVKSIRKRPIG